MADLGDAFGSEFKKIRESITRYRLKGALRDSIIREAINQITPDKTAINYISDNNRQMHIVLAKTTKRLITKKGNWGTRVSFLWGKDGNEWVSAYLDDEDLLKVTPDTSYLLVGDMRTSVYNSKTYYNFRLQGLITMDEIANYRKSMEKSKIENVKEKEIDLENNEK